MKKYAYLHHAAAAKLLSHIRLFATPWTVAHQAPLPIGFSRQEYWRRPCLSPGIKPKSPALQADSWPSEPPSNSIMENYYILYCLLPSQCNRQYKEANGVHIGSVEMKDLYLQTIWSHIEKMLRNSKNPLVFVIEFSKLEGHKADTQVKWKLFSHV